MNNIKPNNILLMCCFVCFLTNCTKQSKYEKLRTNLLSHYNEKADSLKCKAALFLLEGAKDMHGIEGTRVKTYSDTIKEYFRESKLLNDKLYALRDENYPDSIVNDSDALTPQYLIENIDRAFDSWEKANWKDDISFDVFCEYILPYRSGNERIENWRKIAFEDTIYKCIKDSVFKYPDLCKAATYLAKEQSKHESKFVIRLPGRKNATIPDLPFSILKILSTGTCDKLVNKSIFTNRALAIPIAIDFTPHWANHANGHTWGAIITRTGSIPFILPIKDSLGTIMNSRYGYILSKVYRKTFSENANSHLKQRGFCSFLPELFNNARLIDVTDLYLPSMAINIPVISKATESEYAYLAVSDRNSWIPVGWGTCTNHLANFNKVGKKAVYLPVFISTTGQEPCNYPFYITENDSVKYFKPDFKKRIKVELTRKHPSSNPYLADYMERMIQSKFQVANNNSFINASTVYTITKLPGVYYKDVELKMKEKYQFVRYSVRDSTPTAIAEIAFYDNKNILLKGKVLGMKGNQPLENVFDGNVLTFLNFWESTNTWVGLDLGEPKTISKIRFSARNDKNHIIVGDVYELFYWDNVWKSLGLKMANDKVLVYDKVPTNCLFLLRNYTEGVEERIFSYENGKQVWW